MLLKFLARCFESHLSQNSSGMNANESARFFLDLFKHVNSRVQYDILLTDATIRKGPRVDKFIPTLSFFLSTLHGLCA